MKILCINGQGGVGKDSFVYFCGNESEGIFNFSMVSGIKSMAQIAGCWNGGKELKDRKFLSDLKDLFDDYCDYSFNHVLSNINYVLNRWKEEVNNDDIICFIHAREPKDLKRWCEDYGARAVLIRRPEAEGQYGNHADDQVFNFDYDYCIWNNGSLNELYNIARNFIKGIREEEWTSWM